MEQPKKEHEQTTFLKLLIEKVNLPLGSLCSKTGTILESFRVAL